jgi:putative heme-binding domain-containing protein
MRYRSRTLGPEFQSNLFVAEFDTHRISRVILERQGSTFTGRTELFLSSSDPHLHFTDVLEDADGSLLVVDTGGWFSSGCPTSGGAKPDVGGAIYRVRRKNSGRLGDPRGLRIDWAAASTRQLLALLGDARFVVRDRAIAELARRGDRAVPDLAGMASNGDRLARLGAVWTLTRIDTASARSAVLAAMGDADFGVRQAAARSAFTTRDVEARPRLIHLLTDSHPAVRREAAAALGRLPAAPDTVPALLQALAASANDRMLDHALTYALIEIADALATAGGLDHPLPQVRRAALVALDQMTGSQLRPDQTFPLLSSPVASLRAAALNVIAGRRQWAGPVVAELQRSLGAGRLAAAEIPTVRTLLVKFGREVGIQEIIGRALARPDLSREDRLLILTAAGETPGVQIHASWLGPLQAALASGDRDVTSAAVTVIRAARSAGFDDDLRRIGADDREDPLLRIAALQVIRGGAADVPGARGRGGPTPIDASTFDLAVSLFGSAPSASVRVQAAQMLVRASLTAPQLLRLADVVQTAGPLELQAIAPVLAASRDAQVGLAFLQALAKSPGLFALTEGDIRRSFRGYPPDVVAASAPLVQQLLVRDRDKEAHLTDLASVLDRGDAMRGRRVFESTGHCVLCHRIGPTGAQVGPDLSTIGLIRTGPELLNAVAYPSDSIARGYETYSITLRDGRTVIGTVPRETADAVQVMPASGPPLELTRDQIASMTPVATSLMPPGLDVLLSRQELGDLIAYLRTLK